MLTSLFKDRHSRILFFLMFSIISLLNLNYNILRSARNALVVADLGKGAISIPIFEILGAMPGAILLVYLLTKLLNRFPIHRVFYITLGLFCGFFLLFSMGIYPFLAQLKDKLHPLWADFIIQFFSMTFFVMAELWKIALITVLFWGLINQYIPLGNAKQYYAPLMLGVSLGTLCAGPLVSFCNSDAISHQSWCRSLILLTVTLNLLGIVIAILYAKLWKQLSLYEKQSSSNDKASLSVWSSLKACFQSRYLLLLGIITVTDYIAYGLGEFIFLDVLHQKFPKPLDYCHYMGKLTFWHGLLTAFSALVINPYIINNYRWVISSMITPICFLITEGSFLFALCHPKLSHDIGLLVFLGSLFFCIVRAAKFTLFDTAKELSFVLLDPLSKIQGKLIIDGMGSRLGKGGACLISIVLIQGCGGALASAPIVSIFIIGILLGCTVATSKLGNLVEKYSLLAKKSP